MEFEWDADKDVENRRKHGIAFEDAVAAFRQPHFDMLDDRFDYGEDRIVTYGPVGVHIFVIVSTWRDAKRRIISARRAERTEARAYWEQIYGTQ